MTSSNTINCVVSRSEALKRAWSLTKSCEWKTGEKELFIPKWALKFVYGKLEKDTNLFAEAYTQTGWKFKEKLNGDGIPPKCIFYKKGKCGSM